MTNNQLQGLQILAYRSLWNAYLWVDLKKYLIIRFSSIGDIVLTSPVVRCLKTQTNCEVHYITKKAFAPIVKQNKYIDKVYSIEKEIDEVVSDLKKENYDHIIDLHRNLRTFRLKQKLGRPSTTFPKLNKEKFLLTKLKINRLPAIHIVDRYFEGVKSLGITNDQQGLDYFIPQSDEIKLSDLSIPAEYIAFSIGAQFGTKRMPNDKIIALIKRIKLPVVLLGGPGDKENGESITNLSSNVINMCGELSLNQSASILKQSVKVISHDTGLMHIASAFGKSIVSIWGNTIPELGMYPYLPKAENYTIHQVKLKCRPCSKIGYTTCPKKHFNCMQQQDINAISKDVNN